MSKRTVGVVELEPTAALASAPFVPPVPFMYGLLARSSPANCTIQGGPVRQPGPPQASLTALTSFCRVSLASPKSMVVLGS